MELQPHQSVKSFDMAAKHQSILVIDDSLDSLYLGRALLESDGYQVFTASSGFEALNILEEILEPDLVLLDMQMEDMSGYIFLDKLEKINPSFLSRVPVVFYSANENVQLGKASGFICKTGGIDVFLKQVRGFINQT